MKELKDFPNENIELKKKLSKSKEKIKILLNELEKRKIQEEKNDLNESEKNRREKSKKSGLKSNNNDQNSNLIRKLAILTDELEKAIHQLDIKNHELEDLREKNLFLEKILKDNHSEFNNQINGKKFDIEILSNDLKAANIKVFIIKIHLLINLFNKFKYH